MHSSDAIILLPLHPQNEQALQALTPQIGIVISLQ